MKRILLLILCLALLAPLSGFASEVGSFTPKALNGHYVQMFLDANGRIVAVTTANKLPVATGMASDTSGNLLVNVGSWTAGTITADTEATADDDGNIKTNISSWTAGTITADTEATADDDGNVKTNLASWTVDPLVRVKIDEIGTSTPIHAEVDNFPATQDVRVSSWTAGTLPADTEASADDDGNIKTNISSWTAGTITADTEATADDDGNVKTNLASWTVDPLVRVKIDEIGTSTPIHTEVDNWPPTQDVRVSSWTAGTITTDTEATLDDDGNVKVHLASSVATLTIGNFPSTTPLVTNDDGELRVAFSSQSATLVASISNLPEVQQLKVDSDNNLTTGLASVTAEFVPVREIGIATFVQSDLWAEPTMASYTAGEKSRRVLFFGLGTDTVWLSLAGAATVSYGIPVYPGSEPRVIPCASGVVIWRIASTSQQLTALEERQ